MRIGNKQLLFVAGAILLTAALYFAPRQKSESKTTDEQPAGSITFDVLLRQAKGQLKRQEMEPIRLTEAALAKDPNNVVLLDSLGKLWDRAQFPIISSHYYEAIATIKPDEQNWINAAFRYFDAYKSSADTTLRALMVQNAIRTYNKVLEINPKNLDAKTDLGLCYVDAGGAPMQGIMMLREVVKENPEHENAQFNLGILSMRSGQFEKAAERFEKVLSINPNRLEAKFLLGKAYVSLGRNDKALENLEELRMETKDTQLLNEVNSLINQVNNH